MLRFLLSIAAFVAFLTAAKAQRQYDLFWVEFTHKPQNGYSFLRPQDFLSQRAIERRRRFGIEIDSTDLPVAAIQLELLAQKGAKIRGASRWLNGALAQMSAEQAEALRAESKHIASVQAVGYAGTPQRPVNFTRRNTSTDYRRQSDYYGAGNNQAKMVNSHLMHAMQWRGAGIEVAVFDGGFLDMRETPAFYSLFDKGQVLGTRDFVEGDEFVYESDGHGRDVLSTIAAHTPYVFVGTAPDASFYLFKTEDASGEYLAEEFYWLLAAEYADSLGVDVIVSSLGYHTFDDKRQNHAYVDLDGRTTPISRAALAASQKGVLVVSSAGNEGNNKWKHITAPADVPEVLTVGAVDRDGFLAPLSSRGFANRPYIKPDVVARGSQAVVAHRYNYETVYNSGTSFACPIAAGVAITLMQALPQTQPQDIHLAMRRTASQAERPDTERGYGVANAFDAYKSLTNSVLEINANDKNAFPSSPKVCLHRLDLFIYEAPNGSKIGIEIQYPTGEIVFAETLTAERGQAAYYSPPAWKDLPTGIYYLYVRFGKSTHRCILAK